MKSLAEVVFRTDPRVIDHARRKFETRSKEELVYAVSVLLELGESGHEPEAEWWKEARALGERVGRHWNEGRESTPRLDSEVLGKDLTNLPYFDLHAEHAESTQAELARFEKLRSVAELIPSYKRRVVHTLLRLPWEQVSASSRKHLSLRSRMAFRPRRLILSASFAQAFVIHDIRIGNRSQLANEGALAGDLFSPAMFPLPLDFDTIHENMALTIEVENTSGAYAMFEGAFLGLALVED